MASEKLTQKALEQHDKIHPKLQSTKVRSGSQNKDDRNSTKGRTRLLSRTESHRSFTNNSPVPHDHQHNNHNSHHHQLDRQSSKASLNPPKARTGMTVFRVVAAARAWKRLSQRKPAPAVPEKPKVALENTYRLGPEPEQTFKPDKVKATMGEVISSFLRNFKYTPEGSKRMCMALSTEIKLRVKKMDLPRYKLVCNVLIMQNAGQASQISSRCIWNPATDSYASFTYKTEQVVCIANVHAVYME